jgi:hypothetical protein
VFTELVDTLRCVAAHEDSWLVAAADETVDRHIMSGTLGCPVCHARYEIARGIADFAGTGPATIALDEPGLEPSEELAFKLAAMLDVSEASGYVILMGRWTRLASALRAIVPVQVLALNPMPDVDMGDGVSGVRAHLRVPVLDGSALGGALDATSSSAHEALLLQSAIASVKPGARIVAPIGLSMPDTVRELVRDDAQWVGVREGGRPLLQLIRARD